MWGDVKMTERDRVGLRLAAVAAALAMLAASCGGSSGNKATGSSTTTGGPTGPSGAQGTPKSGGRLVMGVEAEVDGFDPTSNRWDVTGLTYSKTVYDPLAVYGKDNQVHPYLAQSIDHNADYTAWTIKLRPNITFSNGDPLTSDAVVADLQALQKAALTGPAPPPAICRMSCVARSIAFSCSSGSTPRSNRCEASVTNP